ncbi:Epidermal growth factor-like domain and Aldolase-type TIM barrel domain and Glycoside hydrolase, superfamily domain and Hyaluronidase family-containing protein [Strongyloides ratti]|uniref:Hyaluronidase n=1 Tax=Strongyloides ratti TaxID=34506 RepID=A0A090LRN2_STRRB|nr:Epidermal growth factor-like domain and Aldolase-type TIM barrel domain and Glycoside hydrolase, superfamily domain and Hyaluronidase family-containing protein [Strongyloides ratti]CEF70837.1 Epidermal growth factor-like domain and Aldolase-type TIM barrel domain and Glycoside hydrolase, superfamily domain and Hyaluronidase family-containing protein [Strongyloides ratti]
MTLKILAFKIISIIILFSWTIKSFEFNTTKFFWNVPSEKCFLNNITIPLEKYGIISNENQTFHGNRIVLIYEKDAGLYPYIKKINNTIEYINGGIPQKTNISAHLEKLRNDIERIIPNHKYDGLAIIDLEAWRPTYDSNWSSKRIYREESINYVLSRLPNISRNNAIEIARDEFDTSALNFLLKTLKECQYKRPYAKWGFYGFPICDENGLERNASFCYPNHDEKLIAFLKYTDALYPTAYLYPGRSYTAKSMFVDDVLKETLRLNDLIEKEGYSRKKIYVYHKFELNPYNDDVTKISFYDPYHLCITYKKSVEYGVDGLVLWSTSKNIYQRCRHIQKYVETQLGLYILSLGKFFDRCSNLLTLNNGKCILNRKIENYKPSCRTGFYGLQCEESKYNPTTSYPMPFKLL